MRFVFVSWSAVTGSGLHTTAETTPCERRSSHRQSPPSGYTAFGPLSFAVCGPLSRDLRPLPPPQDAYLAAEFPTIAVFRLLRYSRKPRWEGQPSCFPTTEYTDPRAHSGKQIHWIADNIEPVHHS